MTSSVLQKLALVGALFAAGHGQANETYQVVSEKGTTNIVERIDFPVGDIKDIIPAGDKYIIHANPIDSLKDSVAVDALFVMEKANPNAAFGRMFSKEIHSVAYLPGLDMATWSYKSGVNSKLLELKNGDSALRAAGATGSFVSGGSKIMANTLLYSSTSNNLHEVGGSEIAHDFYLQDGRYVESQSVGSMYLGSDVKLSTANEWGVFILSPSKQTLQIHGFIGNVRTSDILANLNSPTSIGTVPSANNINDGYLIIGNSDGDASSYPYTEDSVESCVASANIFNTAINAIALTSDDTVKIVSTNDNSVVEANANLNVLDRLTPNNAETGYRKVITDGNDTLLLSNTQSNYFYRVNSR